jgi:hypothetical protein
MQSMWGRSVGMEAGRWGRARTWRCSVRHDLDRELLFDSYPLSCDCLPASDHAFAFRRRLFFTSDVAVNWPVTARIFFYCIFFQLFQN